ncbi:hypothetical protein QSJ19_04390 [Gordonia sp. ABSL11-1]|uniref:hypothetical protein n=1 Tax=Gordonia sp. ABSL11-1 TaxID=3053924 RepID=UPI002574840F|nr:hypothetical protein [Gordonia sp. ABSL11-1]MDL9944833.1 hypothetical protein [Gordonia sp. ABSL11-1]
MTDTAPGKVGTNIDVIKPGPQYQPSPAHPKFYAVRKGGDSKGVNDDLLLRTNRINGHRVLLPVERISAEPVGLPHGSRPPSELPRTLPSRSPLV